MGLFKVRRTTTPGLIPAGLTYGEMAVNLADRILYVGGTAENAIEIAGGSGNYRFFYQADAPGLSQGYGITGETGQYDHLVGARWIDSDNLKEYVYLPTGNEWNWAEPANLEITISGGIEEWVREDPTTATTLEGIPKGTTGLVDETPLGILERILYPYQNMSFAWGSSGLTSIYELGQSVNGGQFTATWTSSSTPQNWVSNSSYIRYTGLASGTALTAGSPTANSATVQYPTFRGLAIGDSVTFSLTGEQTGGTERIVSAQPIKSTWYSKLYWGKSTNSNLTDPSTLCSGSGELILYVPQQKRISVTEGQGYVYIFLHNDYKLTDITHGSVPLSLFIPLPSQPAPVNINNQYNHTMQYKRYRSNQMLNGALNLDIFITA